jgi:hypothetical protein
MVIMSANSVYGHGTIDILKAFELAGLGSSTNTGAPCADLTQRLRYLRLHDRKR